MDTATVNLDVADSRTEAPTPVAESPEGPELRPAQKPENQPGLLNFLGTTLWEIVLYWCVISIGAYIGTLTRFGFQYIKQGPRQEAGFSVMYPQLVGSFVLGVVSERQQAWTAASAPRLWKLLYVFIATGLCVSMTTF